MILTDEQLDSALMEMSGYVSSVEYSRPKAISSLTVLSQAVAELKMRRIMKVKIIHENTSAPGEGS